MYSFDASSIIHAWDNYPIDNQYLNSLWEKWMNKEIQEKNLVISETAFNEVCIAAPRLGTWLKGKNIWIQKFTPEILHLANDIKIILEIEEENYKKGVGENDIFIIANAKFNNTSLITEERKQPELPQNKSDYKIPAVCDLKEVSVRNINFTELLNENIL